MGIFKRKKQPSDDDIVDPNDRSPQLGLKYKDLSLLGVLMDQGAQLDQPRHVLHYSYFPSSEIAEQAATAARAEGWQTSVRESVDGSPAQWNLVAERPDAVLIPAFVRESTDFFEGLATRLRGEYDGWEAGV